MKTNNQIKKFEVDKIRKLNLRELLRNHKPKIIFLDTDEIEIFIDKEFQHIKVLKEVDDNK